MLKITTLPSGLRIATYKMDRRMVKLIAVFNSGRRFEAENEQGTSHFLEHILFSGTKSYPNAKLVKDSVESLGGYVGGSTYTEFTRYDIEILSEYLDQGLKTLQEMITKSLLNEEDITKQKTIIAHELKGYIDDPEDYASRSLNQLLWPNQQLGYSIEKELENLPNITRESLKKYLDQNYLTSRAVICAVGDIDHELFVQKAENQFQDLPKSKSEMNFLSSPSGIPKAKFIVRDTKRLNLKLAYYGPSIHSQQIYATLLMRDILRHRLMEEIRYKRGLVYSINVRCIAFQDTGEISIGVGIESGKVKQVLELMFKEIENMKTQSPTNEEILGAKARSRSGLARLGETVFGLGDDLSYRILFDIQPFNPLEETNLFEQVTSDQILESASNLFSKDFKILGIGPEEDIKELESLYGKSS